MEGTMTAVHQLIRLLRFKEEWQQGTSGLTARELYVLEHVGEGEGKGEYRFNEFAERHGIKPSTLTGIVTRLEKGGLLVRRRDAVDRKAVYLGCTARGRAMVARHMAEDRAFTANLLGRLTPAEGREFVRMVEKMTAPGTDARLFQGIPG
ncbi:MAG: MarR family winged helix-turn-helix transcriptional regulator [Negativicutes bacterium]|nr:MarR family winged helix-turn-helix transcriptional regulator [Negativicutes bacterium]MDR3592822.1 MarR family winged helix-turn-helix transcriptional regulator [Negativicutes bacterium]